MLTSFKVHGPLKVVVTKDNFTCSRDASCEITELPSSPGDTNKNFAIVFRSKPGALRIGCATATGPGSVAVSSHSGTTSSVIDAIDYARTSGMGDISIGCATASGPGSVAFSSNVLLDGLDGEVASFMTKFMNLPVASKQRSDDIDINTNTNTTTDAACDASEYKRVWEFSDKVTKLSDIGLYGDHGSITLAQDCPINTNLCNVIVEGNDSTIIVKSSMDIGDFKIVGSGCIETPLVLTKVIGSVVGTGYITGSSDASADVAGVKASNPKYDGTPQSCFVRWRIDKEGPRILKW